MYRVKTIIKKMVLEREFLPLMKKILSKMRRFEWRKEYRLFYELTDNRQRIEAIELGKLILETDQGHEDFFKALAFNYEKINKYEHAENYMKKSLELRTKTSIDHIIKCVDNNAFLNKHSINSKYIYLGGRSNLGVIEHTCSLGIIENNYITKIMPNNAPFKFYGYKERFFNEEICESHTQLKEIRPKMINYFEMKTEKLCLITFNKINGHKIFGNNLQDVININKNIIESIKYNDINKLLNVVNKGELQRLDSLMHKLSTHELIFSKMENIIRKLEDKDSLSKFIDRIRYIIIDLKIYEEIIPEKDYVFCHGDFNRNNILHDINKDKYYVIDWCTYGLGLEGHDIARFLDSCDYTFKQIQEEYLQKNSNEINSTVYKKVFFAYKLAIMWINRLNNENAHELIIEHISPVTEYMEELVK